MPYAWKRRVVRSLAALGAARLNTRVAIAVTLTVLAFAVATGVADLMSAYNAVRRDTEAQTEGQARLIAELAADKLSRDGRLVDLHTTAGLIGGIGNFGSVIIHDTVAGLSLDARHGRVYLRTTLEDEMVQDTLRSGLPMSRSKGNEIRVAVPFGSVGPAGGPRGVVAVSASTGAYAEKQRDAIVRSMLIAGIFLVLLIPTLGVVARRFIQPIEQLSLAMRRVAQGDLDVKLDVHRKDEIGDLAQSFRHMTRKLKTLASEERRLAYVDNVTGLANRERIQRAVESVTRRAALDKHPRVLLFIDLDGFKRVNDVLGHDIGDKLLAAVGKRLSEVTADQGFTLISPLGVAPRAEAQSRYAFLGRLGGDEFVLVARCASDARTEGTVLAAAIISALDKPFDLDGHAVEIGASIGIARIPDDARDGRTAMRHADLAMYEAKDAGRGQFCFFTDDMSQRMLDRLVLEMELRRAVGNDEFEVVYMPKVDLLGGRLTGFEALARWRHPTRGLLSPAVFVPLAEETGLIGDIDRLILRKALRQTSDWAWSRSAVPVAVNMSAKDFSRPALVTSVARALKEADVPGHLLEIEITESAAMIDPHGAAQVMTELKRLGVRFAIDDFGTGFSNLGQLLKLPVDVFKIDRTFVQSIGSNGEAHHLVRTIVALADQLGLETVAEGIETDEQAQVLASLGVNFGQGFLYGNPVTAAEAELLLEEHFPQAATGSWMV